LTSRSTGVKKLRRTYSFIGTWRSLEAHLNGVQGVAGSNPVVPTRIMSKKSRLVII
jgi:hypothetical protein